MIALFQRFSLAFVLAYAVLATACTAKPEIVGEIPQVSTKERFEAIATAIGDAAIQTVGTEALRKHAPNLVPVLDVDKNGVVSLAELLSLNPEDPGTWGVLIFALQDVYNARKKG